MNIPGATENLYWELLDIRLNIEEWHRRMLTMIVVAKRDIKHLIFLTYPWEAGIQIAWRLKVDRVTHFVLQSWRDFELASRVEHLGII